MQRSRLISNPVRDTVDKQPSMLSASKVRGGRIKASASATVRRNCYLFQVGLNSGMCRSKGEQRRCERFLQFACEATLVYVNVAISLLGVAALLCGVALYYRSAFLIFDALGIERNSLIQSYLQAPCVWLTCLIGGSVVALLSILVVWGVIQQKRFCVNVYTALVAVVLLALVGGIVAATVCVKSATISSVSKTFLTNEFDDVHHRENASISASAVAWNAFMIKFSCCGFDNFTDFDGALSWRRWYSFAEEKAVVPFPCCKNNAYATYSYWYLYFALAAGWLDVEPADQSCITAPTPHNSNFLTPCGSHVESSVKQVQVAVTVVVAVVVGTLLLYLAACSILCVLYHRQDDRGEMIVQYSQARYDLNFDRNADFIIRPEAATRC